MQQRFDAKILTVLLTAVLTTAGPARAQNDPPLHVDEKKPTTVVLEDVRDPETQQVYRFTVEKSPLAELEAWSPKNVRKQFNPKDLFDAGVRFSKDTTTSATFFYGSSFLVALREVSLNEEQYPNAFANLIAHQITDPIATLGFVAFSATHKGHDLLSENLGERYGILRNPQEYNKLMNELINNFHATSNVSLTGDMSTWNAEQVAAYNKIVSEANRLYPVSRYASGFGHVRTQSGFFWAFLASTLASDLAHDENFRFCSLAHTIWSPQRIMEETAKRGLTPKRACDLAWSTWVSSEKIYEYGPDIAAGLVTSGVLGIGVPVLKNGAVSGIKKVTAHVLENGSERAITILLRGIQISRVVGEFFPSTRVLSVILNGYTFLEMSGALTPIFKDGMELYREAPKLAAAEAALSQPSWLERIPKVCKEALFKTVSEPIARNTPYSTLKLWLTQNQNLPACHDLPPTQLEALKTYSDLENQWREFWFSQSRAALANWQSYVVQFHESLKAATDFYESVLTQLQQPNDGPPEFIDYKSEVVDPVVAEYRLRQIIGIMDKRQVELAKSSQYATLLAQFKDIEKQILTGDFNTIRLALDHMATLTQGRAPAPQQLDVTGLTDIRNTLQGLRIITPGMKQLLALAQDKSIFHAGDYQYYPPSFQRYEIHSGADYFLTTMVCGPDLGSDSIRKIWGFDMLFIPPNLTNPATRDMCRLNIIGAPIEKAAYRLDEGYRRVNGKVYTDLWAVLRGELKADYRGPKGIEKFKADWKAKVTSQTDNEDNQIVSDYAKLLKNIVGPAVERKDSYSTDGKQLPYGRVKSLKKQIITELKVLQDNNVVPGAAKVDYLKPILADLDALDQFLDPAMTEAEFMKKVTAMKMAEHLKDLPKDMNFGAKKSLIAQFMAAKVNADFRPILSDSKNLTGEQLEVKVYLIAHLNNLTKALAETSAFRQALSSADGV